MIINEDFFDSEELDNEVVPQEVASENNFSGYKYIISAVIPEEHIRDFPKERFKNIMDRFVFVDYSVKYIDNHIWIYFNHNMKTLKQYLSFLLTVYNAAGRMMIDNWAFLLNENDFDDSMTLFADLSVIINRYTEPSKLTFVDTVEAMRILKEVVFILNDGKQIFNEDDYSYIFNICMKSNTTVAEKIFIERNHKTSGQLYLQKKNSTIWTTNDKIQEVLTNPLHIDSNINIKEVSVIEVSFKNKRECGFREVAMDPNKPDFMDAISDFKHSDKLQQRTFFEIFPKQCPFYINFGDNIFSVYYPVGQFREKDKQTVCMYYLKIMYGASANYNNYMGFANFLLNQMEII